MRLGSRGLNLRLAALLAGPGLAGAAIGCSSSGTNAGAVDAEPDGAASEAREASAALACEPARDDLLAWANSPDGASCPWRAFELSDASGADTQGRLGFERATAEPGKERYVGDWPDSCVQNGPGPKDLCRVELHLTELGPGLLVIAPQPGSEMPRQLWWAAGEEGGLEFAPLFLAPGVIEGGTMVGPMYARVPASCAGAWGWSARARLGGAQAEGPDPLTLDGLGALDCVDLGLPLP